MKTTLKILLAAATLLIGSCAPAMARDGVSRWCVSTNIPTWLLLGTANAELHLATGNHWSVHAGIKYNPFTYAGGTPDQLHIRELTPSAGVRYWADSVWQGWWAGTGIIVSEYSLALPFCGLYSEGNLAGAKLVSGYDFALSERLSLSLGAGVAAALHRTSYYEGPVCGRLKDKRKGVTVFPSDIIVSMRIKL
ncbi:MAG: DUF3575 domain-containing protein [Bacteroidales bacterium]|nr:DUF3575 domain-containing protein [Bacteroidales bacterium]